MNRRLTSTLILSLFFVLPLLTFFQNCSGRHSSGGGSSSPGAGQASSAWPLKLSGDVDPDAFDLSTDGSLIVFLADRDIGGHPELYAAQRDGNVTKLSAGGVVAEFRLLEDKVVYLAEETAGTSELFAVELDGSSRRKLSGPMASGGGVLDFDISPDGKTAVFRADKDLQGVNELYASDLVSLMAPTPVKLHAALSAGQGVEEFHLLNDKAVFRGIVLRPGEQELYSVHLDGSLFLKISGNNVSGGSGVMKFQSNGTGSNIVYVGDLDAAAQPALYRTDVDGVNQGKLSQTPVFGGGVVDFELTEQGNDVVYLGNLDEIGKRELYHRDLVGMAAPNKLNPPLVSGGNVSRFSTFSHMVLVAGAPVITPGCSFVADVVLDDQFELYTASDLNSVAAKANGNMSAGGDILLYAFSPDASNSAYIADEDNDGRFELFSKPLAAASPAMKVVAMANGRSVVGPLTYTPDGAQLLYVADVADLHQRDLWAVAYNGATAKVRLSNSRVPRASIMSYKISGDGHWAVYAGQQDSLDSNQLFISPLPQ